MPLNGPKTHTIKRKLPNRPSWILCPLRHCTRLHKAATNDQPHFTDGFTKWHQTDACTTWGIPLLYSAGREARVRGGKLEVSVRILLRRVDLARKLFVCSKAVQADGFAFRVQQVFQIIVGGAGELQKVLLGHGLRRAAAAPAELLHQLVPLRSCSSPPSSAHRRPVCHRRWSRRT